MLEELEVARAASSEAEVRSGHDRLRPDRAKDLLGELLRLQARDVERELDDQGGLDSELFEQLEAAVEGGEQLDAVAERRPRVRVERDDGRLGSASSRASTILRCPRWTPSNVPSATARGPGPNSPISRPILMSQWLSQ